jgi:hypothetical protein
MTVQCCQCKKVKTNGRWIDASEMLAGRVSHTYCPTCSEALLAEIDQQRAQAAMASRPAFKAG